MKHKKCCGYIDEIPMLFDQLPIRVCCKCGKKIEDKEEIEDADLHDKKKRRRYKNGNN